MPVNTNELRDLATRFIAYLSTDQHDLISAAASELDALRTERNLARAAAGAEQNASCSVFGSSDPHMALLKIEAAAIGVTTDFLEGLERLKESFGGPHGDLLAKKLLELLMDKERADIRRMLPYDPSG